MSSKLNFSGILYFLSLLILIISGISLRAAAPGGIGIFLFYKSRYLIPGSINGKMSPKFNKINLFWSLFFLGLSVFILFSLTKTLSGILLRGETVVVSKWIIPLSAIGSIFYELLYRFNSTTMNRTAAVLLLVIFIQSAGSYILGGYWIYSDLILGFLSFLFTAIISFGNAYAGLSDIFS